MTDPRLERPLWRGRRDIDALTIAVIERAEEIAGFTFTITQGSYNAGGVSQSAGTHDGGGAVDFKISGYSNAKIWKMLRALRMCGTASWHRVPSQGNWAEHIHMVVMGHPALAPSAARQVVSYRNGRNGLASNGPDDGPRDIIIKPFPWEDYMATSKQLMDAIKKLEAKVDKLDADLAAARKAIGVRVSNEADGVVDRLDK